MSNLALIVEDDVDLSTIFAEALRAADFEVEIVQDGQKALTRLAAIRPTIVVLDLHLPQVSGFDILQRIRSDARLANTRVIITTADARLGDAMQDQVDLLLVKPVSFAQLRDLATRLRAGSLPVQ